MEISIIQKIFIKFSFLGKLTIQLYKCYLHIEISQNWHNIVIKFKDQHFSFTKPQAIVVDPVKDI